MKDGTSGPLTRAEFEALFLSVNDSSYARPFVELGEGKGYEAHTQGFEQMARVSLAVDRTTQSLYLLPFSGQTEPPALGGKRAVVSLRFARSVIARYPHELTLPAGLFIAEEMNDFGPDGAVLVRTGRRFFLSANAGFAPGVTSQILADASAEQVGFTYNNVQPGRLVAIDQAGAGFTRGFASVVPGTKTHALVLDPNPDVISAAMVGSYVEFTAGANVGQVRRIVGYVDPNPHGMPPDGGTALLAATGVYRLATVAGQFLPGELLEQAMTGATASCVFHAGSYLVADRQSLPNLATNALIVGTISGAVAVANSVDQAPDLTAETVTATWKVLGWADDFGLTVTNDTAPAGGAAAMLDELAGELTVARAAGEDDDGLRDRAAQPVDLITPNAILRAANRVLSRIGLSASMREVGLASFPGLYFDGDPLSSDPAIAYAFDMDLAARGGADAFKLDLDYLEFRAFFLIGVPSIDLGDFGVAFDVGSYNAFDAAPWLSFFDGFPLTASSIYRTVWQEVNRTKAAGVSFDLIID